MHVMVQGSDNKDLVVVLHRLRSVKLLRFLQSALQLSDFVIVFRMQNVTVRNPTIISSKNDDFTVIHSKRPESISRTPRPILVDQLDGLPSLRLDGLEPVQPFHCVQCRLSERVSSSRHVDVSAI